MSKGKGWDLSSRRSLDSAAEWIRNRSGALLVLVVRAEDMAFAVDRQIAPVDATSMVEFVLPELYQQLTKARQTAKEAAEAKRQLRGVFDQ